MEFFVLFILAVLTILNIIFDISLIALIIHLFLFVCTVGLSLFCSLKNRVPGAGILYYLFYFGVIEIFYSFIGNILLYNGFDTNLKFIILIVQILNFILLVIFQKREKGRIY